MDRRGPWARPAMSVVIWVVGRGRERMWVWTAEGRRGLAASIDFWTGSRPVVGVGGHGCGWPWEVWAPACRPDKVMNFWPGSRPAVGVGSWLGSRPSYPLPAPTPRWSLAPLTSSFTTADLASFRCHAAAAKWLQARRRRGGVTAAVSSAAGGATAAAKAVAR